MTNEEAGSDHPDHSVLYSTLGAVSAVATDHALHKTPLAPFAPYLAAITGSVVDYSLHHSAELLGIEERHPVGSQHAMPVTAFAPAIGGEHPIDANTSVTGIASMSLLDDSTSWQSTDIPADSLYCPYGDGTIIDPAPEGIDQAIDCGTGIHHYSSDHGVDV